jgi:copper chaperone CopZ
VGKAALEGLPGVKKVSSGWHNFMESNTVVFDSSLIDVEQMEEALRKAGTYRKTFREPKEP